MRKFINRKKIVMSMSIALAAGGCRTLAAAGTETPPAAGQPAQSTAQENAPWTLVFEDDFKRGEPGKDWEIVGDAPWQIEDGKLSLPDGHNGDAMILCSKPAPGAQRVEYTCAADEPACDLSVLAGMPGPDRGQRAGGKSVAWNQGYFFGFGSDRNTGSKLSRFGVELIRHAAAIIPGKTHSVACERDGNRLRQYIDGELRMEYIDPQPLRGGNHDRVGFYVYANGRIGDVKIFTKPENAPASEIAPPRVEDEWEPIRAIPPAKGGMTMRIGGESLVLAGEEKGMLLFDGIVPGSVVVRNFHDPDRKEVKTYQEFQDYFVEYEEGAIVRSDDSAIPDFKLNVLYGKKRFNHADYKAFGNHQHFVWVDYETTNGKQLAVESDQSALLKKTRAKLERGGPFAIVAFGDSITAGGEASAPKFQFHQRYAQYLRERFPKAEITVHNRGIGGARTTEGVPVLEERVLAAGPDLVLIGFGMNDQNGSRDDPNVGGPARIGSFARDLAFMAETVMRKTGAEVMLVSSFPPHPEWIHSSHQMNKYAEATKAVAEETGCAYADVYSVWCEALRRKDPSGLLGNNINHPSDFGHWLYFEALKAVRF